MRSTKSNETIEVSRENVVAWIAAGLNQMKALKGREIDVYDIDFWSWRKLPQGDTLNITIYSEKKEAERYVNGEKG